MESFRSPWRAHAVDHDDDKTELGHRLRVAARRGELAAADATGLRSGIDAIDDRILLRRIEVRRAEQQAVEVAHAAAVFHGDRDRRFPPVVSSRLISIFSSASTVLPVSSRSTDTDGTSGFE